MSEAGRRPEEAGKGGAQPALVWLLVALIGAHAGASMTRIASTLWVLDAGYSTTVVGFVLSMYSIGPLFLSLWVGRMVDRHGFHRPALLAVAFALCGLVPAALTQHVGIAAFAVFVTNAGALLGEVAVQRTVGRLAASRANADLKRAFGTTALVQSFSTTFSPMIIGLAVDHLGFRVSFALLPLLPLMLLATTRMVPRSGAAAPPASGPAATARGALRALLGQRPVRVLLYINLALAVVWDVHLFSVPVLGHERQMSASAIGFVLGACSFGVLLVRLLISRLGKHITESVGLLASLGISMLALAVYPWLPVYWGMMIGSFLIGVASGTAQPFVLAGLIRVSPPELHGQVLGLRILGTTGVTVGTPMLYGALAAATVTFAPLLAIAGVVGLTLVFAR